MKKIALVCMNYFTEKVILDMLNSIVISNYCELELVIVDNSLSLKEHDLFDKISSFDFVEIKVPEKNLGYFGGLHWVVKGDEIGSDVHILGVVNPDIVFDIDFFRNLVQIAIVGNLGVIAPDFINLPSGSLGNPLYKNRPSKLSMLFKILVHSNRFFYLLYDLLHRVKKKLKSYHKLKNNIDSHSIEYIYAPHGAIIFFTSNYFKSKSNFEHVSFLYSEELFVAEMCRKADLLIKVFPSLKAVHYEHISTDLLSSKVKVLLSFNSLKSIYKEFY